MKGDIKAVIFDVNGVLLLGEGKSFHEYVSKKLNIDIETWFDSIERYWSPMVEGKITKSHFLFEMFRIHGVKQDKLDKIIKKAFKKRFKKNKWLFKQLSKLKIAGYKTAILSDQVPFSYEVFEKYYKLSKRVDISVWSQLAGVRKPNPKVYKMCLKELKVSPKESIFIDNRDWNLKPAKKLGIRTILFQNNKQLFNNRRWRGLFR